ncbi:MAG: cyclase family protein, partial [Comamonas sp.]
MKRQLWDISPAIHPAAPVFPGDTPYSQEWVASIGPGCPVNVSAIHLSPHVGAHADAPLHYDPQGAAIGMVDLDAFLGPCRVIHAIGCGPLIEWQHIEHAINASLPQRVLVRTYQQALAGWDPDLAAYAPETVQKLADLGVQLIGIDTASIDPASSKTLDSHMVIRQRNL